MDEIPTAKRLDPLSVAINTDVGFHHDDGGRRPAAIARLQSVLGTKSRFGLALLRLARSILVIAP